MSAAIPSNTQQPSSLAAVPKAVWAVVGTLALATAGLGGALVARSVDKPAAEPVAATQPAQVAAVQPQAPAAQLQPAPSEPVAQPAPQVKQQSHTARTTTKAAQHTAAQPHPVPTPVQQQPQVVAQAPAPVQVVPVETRPAAVCATCGVVESVRQVQIPAAQGSGVGAVGGVIAGGLLGNQIGGGTGKKVMTVLGAVGGGLAGNEIEKRVRTTTAYDVQVRMEDGSVRTLRRGEPMAVGTRVQVEGQSLRVSGGSSEPRTLRTSASGA